MAHLLSISPSSACSATVGLDLPELQVFPATSEFDVVVDEDPTYDAIMRAYQGAGKDTARFRYSRKQLDAFFAGRAIKSVRRANVRRYITMRQAVGVSPATINRELDDMSAAINWYNFLYELNIPNALTGMALPIPEGRTRWITRVEAEKMISVAKSMNTRPHLAAFIQLALHTGCRRNELLTLEVKQVRTAEKLIVLNSEDTKSKKSRVIPLNAPAIEALELMASWRDGRCPASGWVFPSPRNYGRPITTVQKGFRSICEAAGVTDFRIHDLRHTCASWLVMAGVPLLVVRDLLGHHSIEMTERYAHLAPNQVHEAVLRLEANWPNSASEL